MNSKILIGIIAVTIFGTLGVQGTMVQAGVFPIEIIEEIGPFETVLPGNIDASVAVCPASHPFLIGGSDTVSHGSATGYIISATFDTNSNSYSVEGNHLFGSGSGIGVTAHALCANFNFPMQMGMVGGELLDINTLPLLVGAIGVNPIITGLVGITLAGVAAQAVWFVHRRRKSENS